MGEKANPRYLEALAFATERHGLVRQARKGTSFPYLVHPIRVAQILDLFDYGEDVVVAGFLHDLIEDAEVEAAEIAARFGENVARLVVAVSEPGKGSASWKERKQHTIDFLGDVQAASDVLGLAAADKLDNVRALSETVSRRGKKAWESFNAEPKEQAWYYRALSRAFLGHEPTNLLFRTLELELHRLFPEPGHTTRFFAGKPFAAPADAREYLADPVKHWRPRYSAYELAHAWIGGGVPTPADALLRDTYGGYELVEGFFEREVELGTRGRPSQTDLLVLLRLGDGRELVVGVEGKAREPFGPIVEEWNTNRGKQARLDDLCGRLGIEQSAATRLRYQLLHRTVATLIEAHRYHAAEALMLVHAFADSPESLEDFRAFAAAIGATNADAGRISDPVELEGVSVRLGWVAQDPAPAG